MSRYECLPICFNEPPLAAGTLPTPSLTIERRDVKRKGGSLPSCGCPRLLQNVAGEFAAKFAQMVVFGSECRKALAQRAQLGVQSLQLGFGQQHLKFVPARPPVQEIGRANV